MPCAGPRHSGAASGRKSDGRHFPPAPEGQAMPKAIHPYDVLVRPLITEKGTYLSGLNKYPFEVRREANKLQIKEAVELAFNVSVRDVNTMIMHGKLRRVGRSMGRNKDWKKAIVTLEPGQSIEMFEGV